MSTSKCAVYSSLLLGLALALGASAEPLPEPGAIVTLASVEKALGGTFTPRSPEPGVLFYEETETGYRQVNVFISEARSVPEMKAQFSSQGEPIEDVPGLGDEAMYRPQRGEASVEMKDKSGGAFLLSVTVLNVDTPAATKRFAIALIEGAAVKP